MDTGFENLNAFIIVLNLLESLFKCQSQKWEQSPFSIIMHMKQSSDSSKRFLHTPHQHYCAIFLLKYKLIEIMLIQDTSLCFCCYKNAAIFSASIMSMTCDLLCSYFP